MAVALTRVDDACGVWGHQRKEVYDLAFSGNYATNGETVTAASVGLNRIYEAYTVGTVAAASTPTTAVGIGFVLATNGASVAVRSYESAAAGTPEGEKTNAEAYITGQNIRVAFVGY